MYKVNMKVQVSDVCGTSLQGNVMIGYAALVAIFGKPNADNDGYKTDAEWNGEINGEFFTIYNYKDGKNYCGPDGLKTERIIDWHIGAKNHQTALKVQAYIKKKLPSIEIPAMSTQDVLIESKEMISKSVKEGRTSGNFTLEGHRIGWDLQIQCWKV